MSDVFDKTLEMSADSFFLLPGVETITYFPASGASRQIKAIVNRTGPESPSGLSGGQRDSVEIWVRNSDVNGIAFTEIDTGGDKVQIGIRGDLRPVLMRIVEIISQDAGMMELKII